MVEIRTPEISKAVHYIFMTSQRSKILGMEFLPKTPSTETPGFLKFENGENMKHPSEHGLASFNTLVAVVIKNYIKSILPIFAFC